MDKRTTTFFAANIRQKWEEVPGDYLQWLRDGQHQMDADWRHAAKIELERRIAP